MTATLRPELIQKTFYSFNKYLFGKHIEKGRLIINIDMVGTDDLDFERIKVFNIIKKLPFKQKTVKITPQPNFANAFFWCMSQVKNKYVFHLEEDWELLCPIDLERMVEIMDNYSPIAHLRLSQFKSNERHLKAWQNHAYWNGYFFEYDDKVKQIDGWAGHPSLNRTDFMKKVCDIVNPNSNPEKQIKGSCSKEMFDLIQDHRFGIYHYQNSDPAIKDLGRQWMIDNGYRKAGNKAWFVQWEKTENDKIIKKV